MLELTEARALKWARHLGAGSLRVAEQDYRLVHLVQAIAQDDLLGPRLAFKGGTALNKLYFGENARLSADLDYNVLGTKDAVQAGRGELRGRLVHLLREQDPSFAITHDHSWELLRVTGRYQPLVGGGTEKIKVELSTVERFPITRTVTQPLRMPDDTTVDVLTLPIDELVSTKVRALYGRRKGRDVYDLHQARPLLSDLELIRKMVLYHLYRGRIVYDADKLHGAFADVGRLEFYRRDLKAFLRAGAAFDIDRAIAQLPGQYDFLFQLDDRDHEFLLLARHLLGWIGEKRAAQALRHEHPLARLFDGRSDISEEALRATIDDIRVHME